MLTAYLIQEILLSVLRCAAEFGGLFTDGDS
jgi:hypothetical protein